jgi:uncharacterized Rmd1/YagE family protein
MNDDRPALTWLRPLRTCTAKEGEMHSDIKDRIEILEERLQSIRGHL